MGKIRGTPYMRGHISVHRATTKYFSNSFVFKTEIEKEGLPRDSTPDLGAGVQSKAIRNVRYEKESRLRHPDNRSVETEDSRKIPRSRYVPVGRVF